MVVLLTFAPNKDCHPEPFASLRMTAQKTRYDH